MPLALHRPTRLPVREGRLQSLEATLRPTLITYNTEPVLYGTVWMVLRFVCVIRVPVCARVSRVCVPCVSRLPPVTFYRYRYVSKLFKHSDGVLPDEAPPARCGGR